MKVQTGYLYHIKDEFFEKINDNNLMTNHEKGKKRPTYFAIKDGDLLWFIPLSSKIDKYQRIIKTKINKYGFCNTILIRKIINKDHAILLQNAFPTLEKYIDHEHIVNHHPVKVSTKVKKDIIYNFNKLFLLKDNGINLFFVDIDRIKKMMLEEADTSVQNL